MSRIKQCFWFVLGGLAVFTIALQPMPYRADLALSMAAVVVVILIGRWLMRRSALRYIALYRFPQELDAALKSTYPHLSPDQRALAFAALRQWFCMTYDHGQGRIAMPSQVVDVLWHAFLEHPRYAAFCRQLGLRSFRHFPAADSSTRSQPIVRGVHARDRSELGASLRLALRSGRQHREALPLIFAVDQMLLIPDGFHYHLRPYPKQTATTDKTGCSGGAGCGGGSGHAHGSTTTGCAGGDGPGGGCSGGGCGGGD